jgi:hypothetical protein
LNALCGAKGKHQNLQTDGINLKSFTLKITKSVNPKAAKVILGEYDIYVLNWSSQVKEVSITAYDFAGQRDYLVTHHLFLSSRALYFIVFKM